jgi:hypothetical protein
MRNLREYSLKLLEAVEQGLLNKDQVIQACINYMSEQDVQDMCEANDFFPQDEEDEEEVEDEDEAEAMLNNFNWVGSRHHY